MASLSPQVQFDFTFTGSVAKDIEYASIKESIGKYSGIMPNIKSLQQYIYTNPNNFKGISQDGSKTSCTPTRVDIAPPTNRTPKVYEFEFGTETCVKTIAYDQAGDYTHYQDKRDTGMGGFRGLAGYQGIFANNIMMGLANDNFERHWFANPANTAGSIIDTAEMDGIWTQLIAASAGAGVAASFDTPYQATDIGATPSDSAVVDTLKDLIENSYITLQAVPAARKRFLVTPNVKYAVDNYLAGITGSDQNFSFIQNQGFENRVFFRGIEIVPVWGWQESLNQSIGATRLNDLGADTQYLILLTTADNIWGLTDDVADTTRFETNYYAKDRTVLYDGNWMLGSYIIDRGLCAFAKQNIIV
jgi:hypothetical protein